MLPCRHGKPEGETETRCGEFDLQVTNQPQEERREGEERW